MCEWLLLRAVGISNFNSTAIDELFDAGLRVKPSVNQCGYSIAHHNKTLHGSDPKTIAACRKLGITYSAYSPLGGLTGVDILRDPRVEAVAKAHGKSTAQVALRWLVQQGIVPVTASTNPMHLASDLDIFGFQLSDAEVTALAEI